MNLRARVKSESGRHEAEVETAGARKSVGIPPKESGHGSSVNGGELLMLALATCYGNDLYRGFYHNEAVNFEYMPLYSLLLAGSFRLFGVGLQEIRSFARIVR